MLEKTKKQKNYMLKQWFLVFGYFIKREEKNWDKEVENVTKFSSPFFLKKKKKKLKMINFEKIQFLKI